MVSKSFCHQPSSSFNSTVNSPSATRGPAPARVHCGRPVVLLPANHKVPRCVQFGRPRAAMHDSTVSERLGPFALSISKYHTRIWPPVESTYSNPYWLHPSIPLAPIMSPSASPVAPSASCT